MRILGDSLNVHALLENELLRLANSCHFSAVHTINVIYWLTGPVTENTQTCVWTVIANDQDTVPQFGRSSLRYYLIGDPTADRSVTKSLSVTVIYVYSVYVI